LNLTHQNPKK